MFPRHSVGTDCNGKDKITPRPWFSGEIIIMDKNVKKNKLAQEKADEEALNSILAWVAGGAVLEFILLLLNRYWVNYNLGAELTFRVKVLDPAVKIIAFLALIGAGVIAYRWKKSETKKCLPLAEALVLLGTSAGCFAAWLLGSAGLTVVYTAAPIIVLIAVIYHLYQREFFLISLLCAMGLFGNWLCSHGISGRTAVVCWIYTLCALALTGAALWVCSLCRKENGSFPWKGKKFPLFTKETNFPLLYLTAAVTAAVLVCALVGLPTMALYAVSVAWLLIMAVYYTVKLM